MNPKYDPESDDGKEEAQRRVHNELMRRPLPMVAAMGQDWTKADACMLVTRMMKEGTTVAALATQLSDIVNNMTYEQAERIVVEAMHSSAAPVTHYYNGVLELYKQNNTNGRVRVKKSTRNIMFTTRGMFVVIGTILQNDPAFVPFLNLLGIAFEVMRGVIDEMRTSWQPIAVQQDVRAQNIAAMNEEIASIGGLVDSDGETDTRQANAMLMRTTQSAYKEHYFVGDNATMALANCGIAHNKNRRVHKYFSEHGNKAEAYRLSVHTEAVRAREEEVHAEGSQEAKRRKIKQIVKETEAGLKEDNFGRIPGATKAKQQAAYFAAARAPLANVAI